MTHGLFDCIGLPLDDWAAVTSFVHELADDLQGYLTPDGWFNAMWRDESGAKLVVNLDADGRVEAIPGFAGGPSALVTGLSAIDDTDLAVADVMDDDGQQVTRLCAVLDQRRLLPLVGGDQTFEAVITGLALSVQSYADEAAFAASPDADLGPLSRPRTLPNGTVLERAQLGPQSFIPGGMFEEPVSPMAMVVGQVDRSWTKTVAKTGASFHVAHITTVGALGLYLCWPAELAPLAQAGQTVFAQAYLTMSIPQIWQIAVAWEGVASDCGCPDLYYCPSSQDIECPRHSGFKVCCDRPDAHVSVRSQQT